MLADHDFELPDLGPPALPPPDAPPEQAPPAPAAAEAPAPIVIIEYRRRRLLLDLTPPAFILLMAGALISYREGLVNWEGLYALHVRDRIASLFGPKPVLVVRAAEIRPAAVLNTEPTAPRVEEAPVAAPPAGLIASPTPTQPPPKVPSAVTAEEPDRTEAVVVDEPESNEEAEPETIRPEPEPEPRPRPLPAIGFDRPATLAEVAPTEPEPEPEAPPMAGPEVVSGEEAWAEIRRAAEQERIERERVARLTPIWVEQERLRAEQEHRREVIEMRRTAERNRASFHTDLAKALRSRDQDLPTAIQAICSRYGRQTPPEVDFEARHNIENRFSGMRRADRIRILRACGLPEARILDFLANLEARNLLARDGPRDAEDALIRAARHLLAVPPSAPVSSPPPPRPRPIAEARSVQPPPSPIPIPIPIRFQRVQ